MSTQDDFKTAPSASHATGKGLLTSSQDSAADPTCTATLAASAATASAVDIVRSSRASASSSAPSPSSMAKIITRFLFGEVQLPASYTHIATFLTGLAAGAAGVSALYNYLNRNKCNHAKVQLAVFHVVRFMKAHPSYEALLQRPHDLLKLMEPEVMLMLDQHLTKIEAGEVFKELKRKYDVEDVKEVIRKRVREDKRSEAKKPVAPYFMPVYAPSPRGFLPPDPRFYSPPPAIEEPTHENSQKPIKAFSPWDAQSAPPGSFLPVRCDTPVQVDRINQDAPPSDAKQLQFEQAQYEDCMDIDKSSSSSHAFCNTPTPSGRRSAALPPKPIPAFIAAVFTPASVPKKPGTYCLAYDDRDIYSSDEESDENKVKCSPAVIRKVNGVKCSGTELSPIAERNYILPLSLPDSADVPVAGSAQVAPSSVLKINNWSNRPVMTYSDSEGETPSKSPATRQSMQKGEERRSPTASVSSEMDKENSPHSSPSKKRKSVSPERTIDDSVSASPTRPRSSPLRDITPPISNGTGLSEQPKTPSPRAPSPAQPPKQPLKYGGRGRWTPEFRAKGNREDKKVKKEPRTPATRTSKRITAYNGTYTK
ncbi:hypothetical protein SLS59_002281 [Nothophoma quercina]|uniref:Uncharacterized protein n=1 Tax=Nothophoma quercina TaxID=749835 RepID=A0ABR3RSA4_9PLEO